MFFRMAGDLLSVDMCLGMTQDLDGGSLGCTDLASGRLLCLQGGDVERLGTVLLVYLADVELEMAV